MTHTTHPDKEAVRRYFGDSERKKGPLPSLDEIRRALGWKLLSNNGEVSEVPRIA